MSESTTAGRAPEVRTAQALPSRVDLALAFLTASMLGSIFLALLEVATVFFQGEASPTDPVEWMVLLGATAAVLAPPALALGLLGSTVLLLFPRQQGPAAVASLVVRRLCAIDEALPRLGVARVVALTLTVLVGLAGAFLGVWRLVSDETTGPQAATLVALGLAAGLPFLWFLHQAFAYSLARVLRARHGDERSAVLLRPAVAIGLLLLLGLCVISLGVWRFWQTVLALDLMPLSRWVTYVCASVLTMRLVLRSRCGPRYLFSRGILIGGLLLLSAGHQVLFCIDEHAEAMVALHRETMVAQPLVRLYQGLLDFDGDGHSALLGGADCDDANPAVHPGAREIPGNGIDEDCWGGDEPLPDPTPDEPEEHLLVGPYLGPAPCASGRWNVILITIDTVRWDHTSLGGYHRPTTPSLDALAEQSTVFLRAWSQAPQTKSSMPSLLSGRYSSEVYRSAHLWPIVYPENVLFSELLVEAGYRTAAVLSHNFFLPRFGLSQGFEHWDLGFVRQQARHRHAIPAAKTVTDRGIAYLNDTMQDERPFFLWLHYIDPHHPYIEHRLEVNFGRRAVDRYDEEIRYMDKHMGRFLSWLRGSPYGPSTAVIVHSDHGEGFREHGYVYHGHSLYEDQIRVPMVIHIPWLEARRVRQSVAVIDIAPTVLDICRIFPRVLLQGSSMLPLLLRATESPDRAIFAEVIADARHSPRKVMIVWPWKLEFAVTNDYFRLYDIEQDPTETRDLSKEVPAVAKRLRRRLREWMSTSLLSVPAGMRASRPRG